MAQYKVISEDTELPPGAYFFTVPEYPMDEGCLALFSLGEQCGQDLIVGRWYPDIGGFDWIVQPGRLIKVTRDIILWIIGRIIPYFEPSPCWN